VIQILRSVLDRIWKTLPTDLPADMDEPDSGTASQLMYGWRK